MEVRVRITWQVVIDGQVNTLDINTTTEDICGNTNTLLEVLEGLVATDTRENQY